MVGSLEMSFSSYMRVLEINFFFEDCNYFARSECRTGVYSVELYKSHKGNKFRCLEVLESEFPNAIKHQVSFAEIGRTSPPPQFQLFHYAGSTEGSFF